MSNTLPIALTILLDNISTINSVYKKIDPYDHYAACWVTLNVPYVLREATHIGSKHVDSSLLNVLLEIE